MVASIGGVTPKIVEFALDGLSLRHNAIASNIANAGVIGYRPMQVSFEGKIADILASDSHTGSTVDADLSALEPQVSFAPANATFASTSFETNMVMLNQNALQYQTLVKGLGTYISAIAEAIKEGKR